MLNEQRALACPLVRVALATAQEALPALQDPAAPPLGDMIVHMYSGQLVRSPAHARGADAPGLSGISRLFGRP